MKGAPVMLEVSAVLAAAQAAGAKRVVLANGCFDPLHVGHTRYLQDARTHGDFLVVALNGDAGTRRLKGAGRPVVPAADRAVIVAALGAVDAVLIFDDADVTRILQELKPAVHAKGTDYTRDTVPERGVAAELGIETVITGDPKSHASRELVQRVRATRGGDDARE
jgi:rfaE bifunctional protein nucleotidyltransferase chain/domain